MALDIATIVAKNYLAQARTLVESFLKHNPGSNAYVLLVDRCDGYFDPQKEQYTLLQIEYLRGALQESIPNLEQFIFKYSILELSTAIKPFFLLYLLRTYKMDKLAYIDPDILITNNLDPISKVLDTYSIVLTPHITNPYNDSYKPGEVEILQSGTFNLGFIGLRNNEDSEELLAWWKSRLWDQCIMDISRGFHVDQKWIDLAPSLFNNVYSLRSPGFNVGYWNLHERHISFSPNGPLCNGRPLYFMHFSGFSPDMPKEVSKHQNRHQMSALGPAQQLFEYYSIQQKKHGYDETKSWPYAFDRFSDGTRIPEIARGLYLNLGDKASRFDNPFSTDSSDSFFSWMTTFSEGMIPPLFLEVYKRRIDLQRAFPDVEGQDRIPFLQWMLSDGKVQVPLEDDILAETRAFLAGENANVPHYRLGVARFRGSASMSLRSGYHFLRRYRALRPALNAIKPLGRSVLTKVGPQPLQDFSKNHWPSGVRGASPSKEFGVNIAGYLKTENGMGEAVRSDVQAMKSMGIPHILNDVPNLYCINNDETFNEFSNDNPYAINLMHINADQVQQFVSDRGQSYIEDHYNIGYWTWELSDFPREWKGSFQFLDEIWVPSSFVLDAISRLSPIPVVRMPHAICLTEDKPPEPLGREHFNLPLKGFMYLFMFDFQSYSARKNPMGLIQAFRKAFPSPEDDVFLVLKTSHSDFAPGELNEIAKVIRDDKRIKIINRVLGRNEVLSLLNLADCYVSLHRCEGFGLTMAESMVLGKPVIATAYSGNMDFTTPANSYLVKYRLVEIDRDYGPYKKGFVWAEPDVDDAAKLIRHVYCNPHDGRKTGQLAAYDIQKCYSPEAIGKMQRARLQNVVEGNAVR